MRLEKKIAQSGVASRRKTKQLIANGKVMLNDQVILEPGYRVKKGDVIKVDGIIVEKEELVYFLMNKPKNVITSVSDEKQRKTVIDLLTESDQKNRIFPVGRLDYNTAGALLLTNDGDLAYVLTRPEYEVSKTYLARIKGILSKDSLYALKTGIKLNGYVTKKALVFIKQKDIKANSTLVEITITEGKNHQIKDMFAFLGHKVISLTRTHFAFLSIKGIKRGQYRKLKIHEVKRLQAFKKTN